jgi:hypothetical protein
MNQLLILKRSAILSAMFIGLAACGSSSTTPTATPAATTTTVTTIPAPTTTATPVTTAPTTITAASTSDKSALASLVKPKNSTPASKSPSIATTAELKTKVAESTDGVDVSSEFCNGGTAMAEFYESGAEDGIAYDAFIVEFTNCVDPDESPAQTLNGKMLIAEFENDFTYMSFDDEAPFVTVTIAGDTETYTLAGEMVCDADNVCDETEMTVDGVPVEADEAEMVQNPDGSFSGIVRTSDDNLGLVDMVFDEITFCDAPLDDRPSSGKIVILEADGIDEDGELIDDEADFILMQYSSCDDYLLSVRVDGELIIENESTLYE